MDILEQLELDYTFFVQFIVFSVLFFLLNFFYFRPFQKLFELRKEKTIGSMELTKKLKIELDNKKKEYSKSINEIKKEASNKREKLKLKILKEEVEILRKAHENYRNIIKEATLKSQDLSKNLKKELEKDSEDLTNLVVRKILN